MISNSAAIILSGGFGTRLGNVEKAFFKLNGQSLLDIKIQGLKSLFNEIIVVTNNPHLYEGGKYKIVSDKEKNSGPLMGLYSGMCDMVSEYAYLTAVDMPFTNVGLIKYMASFINECDIVVPQLDDKYEPLCSYYSKNCIGAIENAISKKKKRMISFYDNVNVKKITKEEFLKYDSKKLCLHNINTQKDVKIAEGLIKANVKR